MYTNGIYFGSDKFCQYVQNVLRISDMVDFLGLGVADEIL